MKPDKKRRFLLRTIRRNQRRKQAALEVVAECDEKLKRHKTELFKLRHGAGK